MTFGCLLHCSTRRSPPTPISDVVHNILLHRAITCHACMQSPICFTVCCLLSCSTRKGDETSRLPRDCISSRSCRSLLQTYLVVSASILDTTAAPRYAHVGAVIQQPCCCVIAVSCTLCHALYTMPCCCVMAVSCIRGVVCELVFEMC